MDATFPPPTIQRSFTTTSTTGPHAHAAAMRIGDGFEVSVDGGHWIDMRAMDDAGTVAISVHRDGIPALIAELQRLTR